MKEFNFFQVCSNDFWNKMRIAIVIIGIGILIKAYEEIKVWIGIKMLIEWNLPIADMPWIADKMFSPKCYNLC